MLLLELIHSHISSVAFRRMPLCTVLQVAGHLLVHWLQKRCHVGGEELDLYKVILSVIIIHEGWSRSTVHQKKEPCRPLVVRKIFLNGACKHLMQSFHERFPCDPNFCIRLPQSRQYGLVHILFVEYTRGLGVLTFRLVLAFAHSRRVSLSFMGL